MAEYNSPFAEAQQPYAVKSLEEAQRLYDKGPQQYYSGNTVADLNPNITGGWNQTAGATTNAFNLANNQSNQIGSALGGINAGYQGIYNQAQGNDQYTQNLAAKAAAASNNVAAQAGTLGGARASLAANTAATNTIEANRFNANKALADIGFGASGQVTATQANLYNPGEIQSGIGQQQRSYDQTLMNEDINKFNYQQNAENAWLQNFNTNIGVGNTGGYLSKAGIAPATAGGGQADVSTFDKIAGYGLKAADIYGKASSIFGW